MNIYRRVSARLAQKGWWSTNPDITLAGIKYAELREAIKDGCPGDGEYYCGYDNAMTAVLDLIADAPTITPPNEWVSVEERPPEFPNFLDHIMVIICNKNGSVIPMVRERTLVGYEWVERWLYPWNKIYDGPEIIYWTSLPKPPKGGIKK